MHITGHATPSGHRCAVEVRAQPREFGTWDAAAEGPCFMFVVGRDAIGTAAYIYWGRGGMSALRDGLSPDGGSTADLVSGEMVTQVLMVGCKDVWNRI